MKSRNLTLNLPADLIREAKVYSAQRDITINALVRELLQETLSRETRTRSAADQFIQISERGPRSSIDPRSFRREDLYDRR